MSKTKICKKCKIEKDIIEFYEHKTTKDKLRSECKKCCKEKSKKWRKNNPEYAKEYNKKYYLKNRKQILKKKKEYRKNNPEYIKKWFKNNPEYNREYKKKSRLIPKNRLNHMISVLIRQSLRRKSSKKSKNGRHWEDLVGYTLQDLMAHLESLFKEGMNWDNYGKWHIDHIRQIAIFNFDSFENKDFKDCWALENLQPLWAKENLSRSKKI